MSTLKANTLSNVAGSKLISTDRIAQGVAFAWVDFNGTGTIVINGQYNVSSITDNGVGDYTVNFTTATVDAFYASACQGGSLFGGASPVAKTTSTFRIQTSNTTSSLTDYTDVNATIFR